MKWGTQNKWEWHKWYAWYPVCFWIGEWVWLETVERKRDIHLIPGSKSFWKYRPVEKTTP